MGGQSRQVSIAGVGASSQPAKLPRRFLAASIDRCLNRLVASSPIRPLGIMVGSLAGSGAGWLGGRSALFFKYDTMALAISVCAIKIVGVTYREFVIPTRNPPTSTGNDYHEIRFFSALTTTPTPCSRGDCSARQHADRTSRGRSIPHASLLSTRLLYTI